MTMMITKFHKLIGSKIFWTLFIILVVVSFVLMYAPQIEQSGLFDKNAVAGTIGGKKVSNNEFNVLANELRALSDTDESREEFDQRVWYALAAQKKAADLGITISDKEVDENIRLFFTNRQTGQFERTAYDRFIQNQFGPGKHDVFERLLRDRLLEERVRSIAADNFLIAPSEIKNLYHSYFDEYTVEYASLDRSLVEKDVTVSDEELKAYFEDNADSYLLPEQAKVEFLRVPVSNYYNAASVSTNEIQAYYDQNVTSYSSTNKVYLAETNVVPLAADQGLAVRAATNRVNAIINSLVNGSPIPDFRTFTNEIVIADLEEVQEEIVKELAQNRALQTANGYAEGLYAAMLPRRGKAGRTITDVAAEEKLELFTTDFLTFTNTVPEVEEDANFTFIRTAFALETNLADRVSTPVPGRDYVYVLSLIGKQEPVLPAFEDVKDRLAEAARSFHVGQALFEKATNIRNALAKAMSSNTNFTNIASNYNLKVTAAAPFVPQTSDLRTVDPVTRVIMQSATNYKEGEVTEVMNAGADVIIGYIKRRKTADATDFAETSKAIRGELRNIRQSAVGADYEDFLKSQLGVKSQLKYEIEDEETDG